MCDMSMFLKAGIARYAPTIKAIIETVGTQRAVSEKNKNNPVILYL